MIRFRVVGRHKVTPPDRDRPVEPGRTGSTVDELWVRRLERAGHIRRTDGGSTVFPERVTTDDSDRRHDLA